MFSTSISSSSLSGNIESDLFRLISGVGGAVQMGVELALLAAINPALLSNTAITDIAGEELIVAVLSLRN